MTIQVLAQKGVPKTEVARQLGVSEGTVRYHLRRQAAGAVDGRKDKVFRAATREAVIAHWMEERREAPRPVSPSAVSCIHASSPMSGSRPS